MKKFIRIGVDLAKKSFQVHALESEGGRSVSRKLSRSKFRSFFEGIEPCLVGMEACAAAHHWGRELSKLGHTVRLMPPSYVKPYVKRQKNDAADAEAICEAAQRPSMRFVPVKTEAQQAAALVFRGRDLLVRQRTQISNALRGHMAEYGWIAPKGLAHLEKLAALLADPSAVPADVRAVCTVLLESLAVLDRQIALLDKEIVRRSREDEVARRLMTIPGIGPITATAIAALAPPPGTFAKGRDFAAWVGLTPRQHSTGGKQKLGAISRMGERTLRRLLIIGSSAVVLQASKRGAAKGSWLEQMLARKPRMLVTVALANKTARIVWAVLTKNEDYRAPVVAA